MNYKKLIKLWVGNVPTPEIAQALDVSVATVYSRTKKLREAGVNLPQRQVIRGQSSVIDADELNAYIQGLVG